MSTPRQISDANEPATEPAASERAPGETAVTTISFDSPEARSNVFVTLSHDDLFTAYEVASDCCDVCGEKISDKDEDDDEGYGVAGRGLYVWARGDETRREEVPLCPACAAALGVTALARWEIDEEEG